VVERARSPRAAVGGDVDGNVGFSAARSRGLAGSRADPPAEARARLGVVVQPQRNRVAHPDAHADTHSDADTHADAESDADPEGDAQTDSEADPETITQTESQALAQSHPESHA
jgi:hypothetical protein